MTYYAAALGGEAIRGPCQCLEVERRSERRGGGGLAEQRQGGQLLGGAQPPVVVEQRGRGAADLGARADHERGDVAALVGGVGRAVLAGGAAGALVPGD